MDRFFDLNAIAIHNNFFVFVDVVVPTIFSGT